MLFVLLITTLLRPSNFISWTIDKPCIKKLTIQRLALQELYPALPQINPNFTTLFVLFVPPLPSPPPTPPIALPILPAYHIKNTSILWAMDYANQFHISLNFSLELDGEINPLFICWYQTHIQNVIEKIKVICCSCGLYTSVKESLTWYIHN